MKRLTLLRHAKSGWDDPGVSRDFDRPLNAKGKRAAVRVGQYLRDQHVQFDHIVASPAVRVVDTLEYVANGLGQAVSPAWDKRVYLASASSLLDVIQDVPDSADRILLCGHNPGLEELILMLVPDTDADDARDEIEDKFPTASLAEIEVAADHWGDVRPGIGTLTRFVRPRDLDPALGPDQD